MTSDYGVQISQIHSCREWVKARIEAARWQEASNYIVRACRGSQAMAVYERHGLGRTVTT